jgi:hypothetical protein
MPLPNEASCRLAEPAEGAKFRRKNGAAKIAGKPVDHIFMIQGGKSKLQSVRFPRAAGWTNTEAKKHCSGKFEPMTGDGKESSNSSTRRAPSANGEIPMADGDVPENAAIITALQQKVETLSTSVQALTAAMEQERVQRAEAAKAALSQRRAELVAKFPDDITAEEVASADDATITLLDAKLAKAKARGNGLPRTRGGDAIAGQKGFMESLGDEPVEVLGIPVVSPAAMEKQRRQWVEGLARHNDMPGVQRIVRGGVSQ